MSLNAYNYVTVDGTFLVSRSNYKKKDTVQVIYI